jgi:hypothetical protein
MPAYALTVFLGAFLLFQIEPLIAKYLLPWFGGAPAVWTTCMLFFQLLLLVGYLYADRSVRRWSPRRARTLHLALLSAAVGVMLLLVLAWKSPILPDASWKPNGSEHPAVRLLLLLTAAVGLPFLLLSSTAPLVQAWAARTHPGARVYRLYALSNAASLAALVSYPFFFERVFTIRGQAWLWSAGFLLFTLACAYCANRSAAFEPSPPTSPIAHRKSHISGPLGSTSPIAHRTSHISLWFLLAFGGSVLLLATTNQMCLEVAAIPFLWVLPLCLYLLSFVLSFESDRIYRRWIFGPLLAASLGWAGLVLFIGFSVPIRTQVAAYSAALFAGCMVCHGELARSRPEPARLTSFYLTIAAGGAAGGVLVAIVAPLLFRGFWEIHIALMLTALLAVVVLAADPLSWLRAGRPWPALLALVGSALLAARVRDPGFFGSSRSAVLDALGTTAGRIEIGVAAAALVLLLTRRSVWQRGNPALGGACLAGALAFYGFVLASDLEEFRRSAESITRNFYGVLTVEHLDADNPDLERLSLRHGRIVHGFEYLAPEKRFLPTTYYGPESGIGLALLHHPRREAGPLRVGAVGLGVGTLASYARPGDTYRFYEINPAVLRLSALPDAVFRYVPEARGRIEIAQGDARLSLEREAAAHAAPFDVLAVDAFSSDAIPVHLLTREALQVYFSRLAPDGILALHISNRQLDLIPIVRALADSLDVDASLCDVKGDGQAIWSTTWVLLSPDDSVLDTPAIDRIAQELPERKRVRVWTDDYSNLFDALK